MKKHSSLFPGGVSWPDTGIVRFAVEGQTEDPNRLFDNRVAKKLRNRTGNEKRAVIKQLSLAKWETGGLHAHSAVYAKSLKPAKVR